MIQGIEIPVIVFMGRADRFLEPVNGLVIQPVDLGHVPDADGIFLFSYFHIVLHI